MSLSPPSAAPAAARGTAAGAGAAAVDADLATFFSVSLDLLVIRDMAGQIVRASDSWRSTLGYTPEELQGLMILSLVHPDDLPGTHDSIKEVIARKAADPVLGHVNRYRHKDGGYVALEWRAQRFGDRIYAVARDVTDKIAAEQALREAKAAAEDANLAKSHFLANMSHEIRTPLNGVIGVVDALGHTTLTPAQAEMVALIRASGVTLERLVSDILDVSRIESGRLDVETRAFDLDEALISPIETLRHSAEAKGLTFQVERAAAARGVFLGDSVRIAQILGNLLSNAVKFTSSGGVAVHIDLDETGPVALLTLEVEDSGIGFSADQATHLFQRFSQADSSITRRFGGTGLGLSICRSLAELMGGRIDGSAGPGAGSRFRVELPLPRIQTLAEFDAFCADAPMAAPPPPRRLRVLLAEDHPINQRVVELILGDTVDLTVVADGVQAVAAFNRGPEDGEEAAFDLVLMDMQMPGMDGLTATRAIRAIEAAADGRARIPIIMLSANAMAEHRQNAAEAGADLHLAKPVTVAALLGAIQTVTGA